ncbi:MAG: hypothetical protein LAP85_26305 [Acidobacteriia bacterium]|nr:hypothetical protein [Terriglobia bacterium]
MALTDEDEVGFEMIVASFQEFLESEIGRSMHENWIQAQRAQQEYNGRLTTNVRFLMEYILSLCRSPWRTDLEDVPIKLWVKYMPDSIARVVRKLYIPEEYFFDTMNTVASAPPEHSSVPIRNNSGSSMTLRK